MITNNIDVTADNIAIIDTLIGFEEQTKNEKKEEQLKRLLAARRAIETHQENKELKKALYDEWLDE
jgi:hypothetical protein